MKPKTFILSLFIMVMLVGCTTQLHMDAPPMVDLPQHQSHPFKVGLYIPHELRDLAYVLITSPFDKMAYPIGQQTATLFEENLPLVFKDVIVVDSKEPNQELDLIIEPSIVNFKAIVPHPAYNPYTATVVYRILVYDRLGETIFTQTATGEHQTSKGLLSGFSARKICAEVAHEAMKKSMKQILEGLLDSEEISNCK